MMDVMWRDDATMHRHEKLLKSQEVDLGALQLMTEFDLIELVIIVNHTTIVTTLVTATVTGAVVVVAEQQAAAVT